LPAALELRPTPDILASLKPRLRAVVTLGFAAESTGDLAESGARKLAAKGLDLLFANPVGRGRGFGTPDNEGVLLDRDGTREVIPRMPKGDLADLLLDRVVARLRARTRSGSEPSRREA